MNLQNNENWFENKASCYQAWYEKIFKEFSSLERPVDGIKTLRRIKDKALEAKKLFTYGAWRYKWS